MAETLFDIPTKDLPSANEGETFVGEFKVQSVDNGIAHVALTTAHIVSEVSEKKTPISKKGSFRDWISLVRSLPKKNTITAEDRKDERYIDLLKKHAPWYLQQHAPELLD